MSFLSSPRALYITRLVQLAFTIGFLILVCYSSVHRGWWHDLDGALALGIITSILTLILTLHFLITHHLSSTNPFTGSTTRTILRLVIELILILFWIATAALMLRPHNCYRQVEVDGQDRCYPDDNNDDRGKAWSDQPLTQWDIGVAFGFVEIVSFILTGFLVWKEDRANKVGGGASYA